MFSFWRTPNNIIKYNPKNFRKKLDKALAANLAEIVIDCRGHDFKESGVQLSQTTGVRFKNSAYLSLENFSAGEVIADNCGVVSLNNYQISAIRANATRTLNLQDSKALHSIQAHQVRELSLKNVDVHTLETGGGLGSVQLHHHTNLCATDGQQLKQWDGLVFSQPIIQTAKKFLVHNINQPMIYNCYSKRFLYNDIVLDIFDPAAVQKRDEEKHAFLKNKFHDDASRRMAAEFIETIQEWATTPLTLTSHGAQMTASKSIVEKTEIGLAPLSLCA